MVKFERIDLGLKEAYEELFMNDKGRKENREARITELELDKICDFEGHPFSVKDDDEMKELMQSIAENGVITPVLVRPKERDDDGNTVTYEMISGHRRKLACEKLGMETIPAVVVELSREEAVVAMTDSNMYRKDILPSELAKAYKMRMDAIKRPAGRPKKNVSPMGTNFRSDTLLAQSSGESRNQIQRYIRLNYLVPKLLKMVDENRIAIRPAVEISFLSKDEQYSLLEFIEKEECTPSISQAQKLKELSKDNKLNDNRLYEVMSQPKANQKEKISFSADELRQYFPKSYTDNEIKEKMVSLAAQYKVRLDRNRDAR